MKKFPFIRLAVAIAICEIAGLIGSVFTMPSIPLWYATLAKPAFSPPNWIFGPVWTTLYALMGVAVFLVLQKGKGDKKIKPALGIFAVQLGLNVAWSGIFFGMHAIGLAFFELVILALAIIATIFAFAKISKPAAWLLAPYLLWVTFAGMLNFALWQLN
jgi:translocator protein